MEPREAVEALASHPKEEVSKLLKEIAPSHWQHVHDVGFSTANARAKENLTKVEESLTAAQATITEKEEKIAELEKGQPDLEQIRDDHRKAVQNLTTKHAADLEAAQKSLADTRRDNVYHRLLSKLGDLDDEYASLRAQAAMSRMTWDKEGKLEVMQESGVPYVPSDKKDGIALLAEEIVTQTTETKPKFVKSDVDRGSGGNNGKSGTKAGSVYDRARETAKTLTTTNPEREKKVDRLMGVAE